MVDGMSKYQALIDALEAGPTDGPWSVDKSRAMRVRNESDCTITSAGCADSLRHEWEANAAYIAAANPSTIRALLADLERAEKAQAVVSRLLPLIFDCAQNKQHESVLALVTQMSAELAQMAGG